MDTKVLALAKKYTDEEIAGAGAIKGAPCQISEKTPIEGGTRLTFLWEDNEGEEHTDTLDVMNGAKGDDGDVGLGIKSVSIDANGHLIVTFDDDTTEDAGALPGGGDVSSVNGKKGAVELDAEDVGALPDDTPLFSGDYDDLSNKPSIPSKISDLTNDSGFIQNTVNNLLNYYLKSESYTKAEVDALISAIVTIDIRSVATLPTEEISTTTIYLVPSTDPQAQNVKDEYIYVNNAWELIGSTEIDLTGYVTDADLTAALASYVTSAGLMTILADYATKTDLDDKQDALTAGDGISIENGEISTNNMPSSDMEGVVTPLPSVMSRRFKYSTDEQVVGEWIDGKPIYQKTVTMTVPTASSGTTSATTKLNISSWNTENVISMRGFVPNVWPSSIISGYLTFMTTIDGFWINVFFASDTKEIALQNHGIGASSTDAGGKTAYITVQYTKTTD